VPARLFRLVEIVDQFMPVLPSFVVILRDRVAIGHQLTPILPYFLPCSGDLLFVGSNLIRTGTVPDVPAQRASIPAQGAGVFSQLMPVLRSDGLVAVQCLPVRMQLVSILMDFIVLGAGGCRGHENGSHQAGTGNKLEISHFVGLRLVELVLPI
jgi:hypothetical protein